MIRFDNVSFRACIRKHDDSIFVGYANATLVVPGVLADEQPLLLGVPNIEVKIVRGIDGNVEPRIDFKSVKGQDGVWRPTLFPKSTESRAALTNAILNDRFVCAVVQTLLEDLDSGRETFAA